MITKIDYIKDYGIFNDYKWSDSVDIPDFKEKNIIYGWNYSGKTTLSRLFSSLRDKSNHPDFENASFKISYDTSSVDNNTLENFPYPVEVFNSEYIKQNLKWDYDENIKAIFFEVGDNAKIAEQIDKIRGYINSINGTDIIKGKKENHLKIIEDFEQFEKTLFTREAGRIKNDSFSSLIEFNKGHLKRIRDKILPDLDQHIIRSKVELSKLSLVVKIESPKSKIDEIAYESNLIEIVNLTNEALAFVPEKSNVIDILDKNRKAYDWAKDGLLLHKKNDKCLFCNNIIGDERFELLNQYFQNQGAKLKEKILKIFELISQEEELVSSINFPSSINDLNEGFHKDYVKLKASADIEVKKYTNYLKEIRDALNRKINKEIFTKIPSTFKKNDNSSLKTKLKNLNGLIIKNNDFTEDFENLIKKEREKYKNHLVADFLKKSKYISAELKNTKSLEQIKKLDKKIDEYYKQIQRLEAKKTSISEGCVQFNSFVQSFLSRDDIEIILNNETKNFNLMRGDKFAQNLSEGEKMAISFSHFLVNLKSIESKGKLMDYIIFIDDPISSLDSNHIFQINSLLKETFFKLIPDPANPRNKFWQILCKQLFVSTHNFEFFTLLKELPKKGYKKDSRYFISRKLSESTIDKLPKVYNTFSSEYHYLFGEIVEFNNEVNKSASMRLLTIPNIIRRFVEMYTLTKYPSNEEVDARAEKIFGKRESKRILKLLHHFSHFNNIDRLHRHSAFVADIEYACADLLRLIEEKDEMHYNALLASLN